MIELQKTWLETETLRFRQYLGTQYLSEENIPKSEENADGFALPMVSIYILGHKVGDLQEPVIYVRRRYLDQESNPIVHGVPDPFVESLTHDSVIVQIPYLKGRVRNHLERLLNLFDQDYRLKEDSHLMSFDEDKLQSEDEQWVMYRLVKAVSAPGMRRNMQVEDEILSASRPFPPPACGGTCKWRTKSCPQSKNGTRKSCVRSKNYSKANRNCSEANRSCNKIKRNFSKASKSFSKASRNLSRRSGCYGRRSPRCGSKE